MPALSSSPIVAALDHVEVDLDEVTARPGAGLVALSLVEALSVVPDPRSARRVRHGVVDRGMRGAGRSPVVRRGRRVRPRRRERRPRRARGRGRRAARVDHPPGPTAGRRAALEAALRPGRWPGSPPGSRTRRHRHENSVGPSPWTARPCAVLAPATPTTTCARCTWCRCSTRPAASCWPRSRSTRRAARSRVPHRARRARSVRRAHHRRCVMPTSA